MKIAIATNSTEVEIVNKGVNVYTEEQHLNDSSEDIVEVYNKKVIKIK